MRMTQVVNADRLFCFTKKGICELYDIVNIVKTSFEYKKEVAFKTMGTQNVPDQIKATSSDNIIRDESIKYNPESKNVTNLKQLEKIKYHLRGNFAEQVEDVLGGADTESTHLLVSRHTPKLLIEAGLSDYPVLMTAKHVLTVIGKDKKDGNNYHNLDKEIVKRLPELISYPVMILDSLTRNDSIVVVTEALDGDKNPIVAAIKPDGYGNINDIKISSNVLTSTYGKENISGFILRNVNENNIIYWNKKKSQELKIPGLQLPDSLLTLDSDTIIHKAKASVNSIHVNNSDYSEKGVKNQLRTPAGLRKMSVREALAGARAKDIINAEEKSYLDGYRGKLEEYKTERDNL